MISDHSADTINGRTRFTVKAVIGRICFTGLSNFKRRARRLYEAKAAQTMMKAPVGCDLHTNNNRPRRTADLYIVSLLPNVIIFGQTPVSDKGNLMAKSNANKILTAR